MVCFNIDLVIMQIERFLALYWDLLYKNRVTTKMAFASCIISKVFVTLITACMAFLNPEYQKCTNKYRLFNLKAANIYLDAYPKLFAICVHLVVSMYVIYMINEQQKKVHPLVTQIFSRVNRCENST